MKNFFPLLIVFCFCLSCGGDQENSYIRAQVMHQTLVYEPLDVGAFLKKTKDGKLLTVIRDKNSLIGSGVVEIDPDSQKINVIDPNAQDAMELQYSKSIIAYRREKNIYLNVKGDALQITDSAKRITSFAWLKDQGHLTYIGQNSLNYSLCLNDKGKILKKSLLDGGVEQTYFDLSGREWLVYQSPEGLKMSPVENCNELGDPSVLIEKKSFSHYVSTIYIDKQLYIAFLEENTGVLQLATYHPYSQSFDVETVDGTPYKSFVGMDIAFFPDGTKPGMFYLDAWKLKLRRALWRKNKWFTTQLPFSGAVGFYTQILNQTKHQIKIAFRSFRSLHPDGKNSFENLTITTLTIPR